MSDSLHDEWNAISAEAGALIANGTFREIEAQALLGAVRCPPSLSLPKATRDALAWAVKARHNARSLDLVLRGLATMDFAADGTMSVELTEAGHRLRGLIPPPSNTSRH